MPKNRYNNINTHATIFVIYSKPLIYHKVKVSCITRLVLLHIPDFHGTNSCLSNPNNLKYMKLLLPLIDLLYNFYLHTSSISLRQLKIIIHTNSFLILIDNFCIHAAHLQSLPDIVFFYFSMIYSNNNFSSHENLIGHKGKYDTVRCRNKLRVLQDLFVNNTVTFS